RSVPQSHGGPEREPEIAPTGRSRDHESPHVSQRRLRAHRRSIHRMLEELWVAREFIVPAILCAVQCIRGEGSRSPCPTPFPSFRDRFVDVAHEEACVASPFESFCIVPPSLSLPARSRRTRPRAPRAAGTTPEARREAPIRAPEVRTPGEHLGTAPGAPPPG